ncbi:hypothetical protein [Helicobacter sp. 11S02596-1]|uniref:hypothetical protein n=1 Tax=Helicobacter sp. 11S02596-1 TaxID=1476194 RepID=UPI000BA5C6E7|nr:hypothetical protein [Helicobacter sp. 11S02596-1]PAF41128.1 hypothetical protein BJI48_09040 [Helicobacter sp. 11S02596-1]
MSSKTLSQIINELLDKLESVDTSTQTLQHLKEEIQNATSKEALEELIASTPYLKSEELIANIAQSLPIDELVNAIPKEEIKATIEATTKEALEPGAIVKELGDSEDFNKHLNAVVRAKAREVVLAFKLPEQVLETFDKQVGQMVKNHLENDYTLAKTNFEASLSLQLIRLKTNLILMESYYQHAYGHNILKRI